MTTVAFIFSKEDLKVLEARPDFESLKLIALTPEADFALEQAYPDRQRTIEDYYSEKELNLIGNNSLDKVKELCDAIDKAYVSEKSTFSCGDLYFYIKVLYDQILINHTFCRAILNQENPKSIVIPFLCDLSSSVLKFNNDDLMMHQIYYYYCEVNKIPCSYLRKKSQIGKTPSRYTVQSLRILLGQVKLALENFVWRIKNYKEPGVYMLQHWDFETCKKMREFFELYWCHNKAHVISEAPCSSITIPEKIEEILSFDGISYAPLAAGKIAFLTQVIRPHFEKLVAQTKINLAKRRIKIVVAASSQSLRVLTGIKAARLLDLPVVWGQHGGLYGYGAWPIGHYLQQYYTHYFLYADGVWSINNGKNCITVGDTKLTKIWRKNRAS